MRKRQRIISFLLCICMLLSIAAVGSFSGSAAEASAETVAAAADPEHPELAQATIQGGAILHCFCWSFDQIRQNLAQIAAAGYTAVQTSPVQPPTDYSSNYTNTSGQWWKLYQPLDMAVTDGTNYNSWLGTKSQLTQLCTEAENYGIKVIVDIVSNHVANDAPNSGTFEHVNANVADRLKKSEYYHDIATQKPSGTTDRYKMTHYHIGMPDLNTENTDVQDFVIGLCEECIDCGVDGFRFDTAKAIEVPNDPEGTRSDYWPNVINAITAKKADAFIYGEALGNTCTSALTDYTAYMKLTDDVVGNTALINGVVAGNAQNLANSVYSKKANDNVRIAAEDSIIWAESHDTYMNDDGASRNTTNAQIVKAWAIEGARNQSTSLFFARPNPTMGLASSDTTWKSAPVVEVNKFKNLFDGKSEYLSYDNSSKVALLERGKKGAVISKISSGTSVSISVNRMVDGEYTDHVSGSTFTVSNGVLTGTLDSSGVAVIYNANDIEDPVITASKLYLSPTPGWTLSSNRDYAMYLFNDSDDEQWVSMSAVTGHDGVFAADVPNTHQWTGVIFVRKDINGELDWSSKKNQTVDLFPSGNNDFFTVAPAGPDEKNTGTWSVFGDTVDDTPNNVTNNILYLDYSDLDWWISDSARLYAYFYTGTNVGVWEPMISDDAENVHKVTIPSGNYSNVIFARLDKDTTTVGWSDVWNQSKDLDIPAASDNNRCFKFNDKTVTNSNNVKCRDGEWGAYHPAHTFIPTWSWSNNNATATLTLSCACGRTLTFQKSVTPVSDDDKDVFTASVRYGGQTYSDTQTVYKRPTFEGHSVTVDGKIGLYFYVDLHKPVDSPKIAFTCNNKTTEEALVPDGEKYRAAFYVAPKQMGDTVTATVTVDGKTTSKDYTVKDYLLRLYRNENGEAGTTKPDELRALARSLLNYGAKAQLQFGYKTTDERDLVDYGLTPYTPASPAGQIEKLSYAADQFSAYNMAYAGSSLILNNDTTLRVFFSKTGGFTSAPTLTCGGKDLSPGTKGSYITYDITGIPAPYVLSTNTVTFPNNSTAGFTACNYILNKYSSGDTIAAVVNALYDYSVKASAYLS